MSTKFIPTEILKIHDIPNNDADWSEIWKFAHSYHSWVDQRTAGECANTARKEYEKSKIYSHDFHLLRTCLWFEWRRYRHFGWDPEGESEEYIRGILGAIKTLLVES